MFYTYCVSPDILPVFFVDLITETNCVHDGEFKVNVTFLQVVRSGSQVHAILVVARLLILKHCVKECVH